jgi:hypothetical protein
MISRQSIDLPLSLLVRWPARQLPHHRRRPRRHTSPRQTIDPALFALAAIDRRYVAGRWHKAEAEQKAAAAQEQHRVADYYENQVRLGKDREAV